MAGRGAQSQQPWRNSLWFATEIQIFTALEIPEVSPHQRALVQGGLHPVQC